MSQLFESLTSFAILLDHIRLDLSNVQNSVEKERLLHLIRVMEQGGNTIVFSLEKNLVKLLPPPPPPSLIDNPSTISDVQRFVAF